MTVDLEARLDEITTRMLLPLRASKQLDSAVVVDLMDVARSLRAELEDAQMVPRRLVGKLWFVFTAMLTEAQYAALPGPIIEAAWAYEDVLDDIFGARF
jgi:hypothetical protein